MPKGVIGLAFKQVFTRWGPWGFSLTFIPPFLMMYVIMGGVMWAAGGTSIFSPDFATTSEPSLNEFWTIWISLMTVQLLIGVPISVLWRGGIAHLSSEVMEGRRASIFDAWKTAGRRFPSLLGIEVSVWLLFTLFYILSIALLMIPSFALGDSAGFGAIGCCLFPLFFGLVAAVALSSYSFEALAVREVVSSGERFGAAWRGAWSFFRERPKTVLQTALAILGISVFVFVLILLVVVPMQFLSMGTMMNTTSEVPDVTDFYARIWPMMLVMYTVVPFIELSTYLWFENIWSGVYWSVRRAPETPDPVTQGYGPGAVIVPQPPTPPSSTLLPPPPPERSQGDSGEFRSE